MGLPTVVIHKGTALPLLACARMFMLMVIHESMLKEHPPFLYVLEISVISYFEFSNLGKYCITWK